MGLEFSGIVEEVGHGSEEEERHNWKKGDEVFGLTYGGAYAEYVAVNKKMLIRKPQELSWEVLGGTCEVSQSVTRQAWKVSSMLIRCSRRHGSQHSKPSTSSGSTTPQPPSLSSGSKLHPLPNTILPH